MNRNVIIAIVIIAIVIVTGVLGYIYLGAPSEQVSLNGSGQCFRSHCWTR